MALAKTGYTKNSVENFMIDSATVFTDVEFVPGSGETPGEFTGTLVGATSGGVSVNIEQTYRKPEVDGTGHMDVVGLKVLESATANATINLKELSAEALRRSLNGTMTDAAAEEAPAGYKKIKSKRYVEESDYIPTIAVVGVHNGTKKPIIFLLDNGLVTSPLNVTTEDNNEAVVEQVLTAHASFEQLAADEFPWTIYYPPGVEEPVTP